MPKYYVYNKRSGEIVHQHEEYDAESGASLRCTSEEVLELVNERLAKEELEVLEVDAENQLVESTARVKPDTRTLEIGGNE